MENKPGLKGLLYQYRRAITFCAVGALNTGVDYLVFSIAVGLFSATAELGQAAGYAAGIINSYILNRRFTFKKGATVRTGTQMARFVLVNAATLGVSIGLISLLTRAVGMSEYLAKIIVTVAVMGLNYFGYKLFVFGVKESKA